MLYCFSAIQDIIIIIIIIIIIVEAEARNNILGHGLIQRYQTVREDASNY